MEVVAAPKLPWFLLVVLVLVGAGTSTWVFPAEPCPLFQCGLDLLLVTSPQTLPVVTSEEVEVLEPDPLPEFCATEILTSQEICSESLIGNLVFLVFVDLYFFDYQPFWPPDSPQFPGRGESTLRLLRMLQAVHETFAEAGVMVVGVLMAPFGDAAMGWGERRTAELANELGLTFPLVDGNELFPLFGLGEGVLRPRSLVIAVDREGRLRFTSKWPLDDPIICGLALECQQLKRFFIERVWGRG
jgi:hypothetical protein